jgi:hypothetical protein
MSQQTIATRRSMPTGSPERGTRPPVATLEHRTHVHPIPQIGCLGCLPAPCVCGQHLCPDAVVHRRDLWSAEQTWREVA